MPRSKNRNKDYYRGIRNRTAGLIKKADQFHCFYPEYDIGIMIRTPEKQITGFQSYRGFLQIVSPDVKDADLTGPDEFVTVADQSKGNSSDANPGSDCSSQSSSSSTPETTSENSDVYSTSSSCGPSTPESRVDAPLSNTPSELSTPSPQSPPCSISSSSEQISRGTKSYQQRYIRYLSMKRRSAIIAFLGEII